MTSVTATGSTATLIAPGTKTGFAALGQADFIKMMTAQLQQQDPTSPVDNKEMLAQMAQFSSLSGITDVSVTLKDISAKLDAVLAARSAAASATSASTTASSTPAI